MTFGAETMAQMTPPPPPPGGPRMPALSALGLAAMGAGMATMGAYRLLKAKRKKADDTTPAGPAPGK